MAPMGTPTPAPRPWRPSGVVTLLTDYGLDDPYVGIVKGCLWRDAPRLRAVVDLTHAVPPGDVAAGAFLLERAWHAFPAGTVHVAIVDPGVGTARALLLVEARGHVFLAPDNGLVAPLITAEPLAVVRVAGPSAPVRGPSTTFDGRDRFAPLAARLVEGDPPATFGARLAGSAGGAPGAAGARGFRALALPVPARRDDGAIEAEVVHVDRFGNLITNVPAAWLAESGAGWRERWRCRVGARVLALVRTYGDAPPGTPVALADSYERMEVALSGGSAAAELGLARGARVTFEPADGGDPAAPRARKRARPASTRAKKGRGA
jgi:S-adenosylmethionine hydrolase